LKLSPRSVKTLSGGGTGNPFWPREGAPTDARAWQVMQDEVETKPASVIELPTIVGRPVRLVPGRSSRLQRIRYNGTFGREKRSCYGGGME